VVSSSWTLTIGLAAIVIVALIKQLLNSLVAQSE
jgi:hypothetical protein